MGMGTRAEQHELDALCIQYPEVADAKKTFEIALENQLMNEPINPPAYLKEKVFLSLHQQR